jgi:hypothetical protein
MVVVGYQTGLNGPHFFCYLFDSSEIMETPLWNSLFSLEHRHAQQVDEFDLVLSQWGVRLPAFIKQVLREDWTKNQLACEYCWQLDGSFDQVR